MMQMKMPIKKLSSDSGFLSMEDILMGLRYAYYVNNVSTIPDAIYDSWEAAELRVAAKNSPLRKPGSDIKEDYELRIRALGMYFTFLKVEQPKSFVAMRPEKDYVFGPIQQKINCSLLQEPEVELVPKKKKPFLLKRKI
jgi:hypothetical protein